MAEAQECQRMPRDLSALAVDGCRHDNVGRNPVEQAEEAAFTNKSTVPKALLAQLRPPAGRIKAPPFGPLESLANAGEDSLGRDRMNDRVRNNLGLVVERGTAAAQAFASVASAFDFQHHVGTDPVSELFVLKRILHRECMLSQLEALCADVRKRSRRPVACDGIAAMTSPRDRTAGVVDMLSRVRDATVAVVESVAKWRQGTGSRHPPLAFVWHGENYLLKATSDLNFLAGVEPLVSALKMHPARFCRNPLMLPQTLDEQRRDGGELFNIDVDVMSQASRPRKRRYLYRIAQALLEEEEFEIRREKLRREATGDIAHDIGQALGGWHHHRLFADRPNGNGTECEGQACSAESVRSLTSQINHAATNASADADWQATTDAAEEEEIIRRREKLSTWYEEARLQLVALSSSQADEEYFLSSRRFWTKQELEHGESVGSGTPLSPPRVRPLTLPIGRGGKRSGEGGAPLSRSSSGGAFETRKLRNRRRARRRAKAGTWGYLSNNDSEGRLPGRRSCLPNDYRLEGLRRGIRGRDKISSGGGAAATGSVEGGRVGRHDRDGHYVVPIPDGGYARWDGKMLAKGQPRLSSSRISSAALTCIAQDDVERLMSETNPRNATTVVCAAVVFLLAPDNNVPEDFCWPQGFEAVARPVGNFLSVLQEKSGREISPFKARVLRSVLQREEMLPAVIEQQGAHTVASLCAWALEELRACDEFMEWSTAALGPWYEMQMKIPASEIKATETTQGPRPGARPVHKSLHALSHGEESYVLTLFEEARSGEEAMLIVRAFDRAKQKTLWLPLSRGQVLSLGGLAGLSPADMVSALARRLAVIVDAATQDKQLVLPPLKNRERITGGGHHGGAGFKRPRLQTNEKANDISASTPNATKQGEGRSTPGETGEATAVCTVQDIARSAPRNVTEGRRSRPPSVRGSTSDGLGPLVESEVDSDTESRRETRDNPRIASGNSADNAGTVASEKARAAAEVEVTVDNADRQVIECQLETETPYISVERKGGGAILNPEKVEDEITRGGTIASASMAVGEPPGKAPAEEIDRYGDDFADENDDGDLEREAAETAPEVIEAERSSSGKKVSIEGIRNDATGTDDARGIEVWMPEVPTGSSESNDADAVVDSVFVTSLRQDGEVPEGEDVRRIAVTSQLTNEADGVDNAGITCKTDTTYVESREEGPAEAAFCRKANAKPTDDDTGYGDDFGDEHADVGDLGKTHDDSLKEPQLRKEQPVFPSKTDEFSTSHNSVGGIRPDAPVVVETAVTRDEDKGSLESDLYFVDDEFENNSSNVATSVRDEMDEHAQDYDDAPTLVVEETINRRRSVEDELDEVMEKVDVLNGKIEDEADEGEMVDDFEEDEGERRQELDECRPALEAPSQHALPFARVDDALLPVDGVAAIDSTVDTRLEDEVEEVEDYGDDNDFGDDRAGSVNSSATAISSRIQSKDFCVRGSSEDLSGPPPEARGCMVENSEDYDLEEYLGDESVEQIMVVLEEQGVQLEEPKADNVRLVEKAKAGACSVKSDVNVFPAEHVSRIAPGNEPEDSYIDDADFANDVEESQEMGPQPTGAAVGAESAHLDESLQLGSIEKVNDILNAGGRSGTKGEDHEEYYADDSEFDEDVVETISVRAEERAGQPHEGKMGDTASIAEKGVVDGVPIVNPPRGAQSEWCEHDHGEDCEFDADAVQSDAVTPQSGNATTVIGCARWSELPQSASLGNVKDTPDGGRITEGNDCSDGYEYEADFGGDGAEETPTVSHEQAGQPDSRKQAECSFEVGSFDSGPADETLRPASAGVFDDGYADDTEFDGNTEKSSTDVLNKPSEAWLRDNANCEAQPSTDTVLAPNVVDAASCADESDRRRSSSRGESNVSCDLNVQEQAEESRTPDSPPIVGEISLPSETAQSLQESFNLTAGDVGPTEACNSIDFPSDLKNETGLPTAEKAHDAKEDFNAEGEDPVPTDFEELMAKNVNSAEASLLQSTGPEDNCDNNGVSGQANPSSESMDATRPRDGPTSRTSKEGYLDDGIERHAEGSARSGGQKSSSVEDKAASAEATITAEGKAGDFEEEQFEDAEETIKNAHETVHKNAPRRDTNGGVPRLASTEVSLDEQGNMNDDEKNKLSYKKSEGDVEGECNATRRSYVKRGCHLHRETAVTTTAIVCVPDSHGRNINGRSTDDAPEDESKEIAGDMNAIPNDGVGETSESHTEIPSSRRAGSDIEASGKSPGRTKSSSTRHTTDGEQEKPEPFPSRDAIGAAEEKEIVLPLTMTEAAGHTKAQEKAPGEQRASLLVGKATEPEEDFADDFEDDIDES